MIQREKNSELTILKFQMVYVNMKPLGAIVSGIESNKKINNTVFETFIFKFFVRKRNLIELKA